MINGVNDEENEIMKRMMCVIAILLEPIIQNVSYMFHHVNQKESNPYSNTFCIIWGPRQPNLMQ